MPLVNLDQNLSDDPDNQQVDNLQQENTVDSEVQSQVNAAVNSVNFVDQNTSSITPTEVPESVIETDLNQRKVTNNLQEHPNNQVSHVAPGQVDKTVQIEESEDGTQIISKPFKEVERQRFVDENLNTWDSSMNEYEQGQKEANNPRGQLGSTDTQESVVVKQPNSQSPKSEALPDLSAQDVKQPIGDMQKPVAASQTIPANKISNESQVQRSPRIEVANKVPETTAQKFSDKSEQSLNTRELDLDVDKYTQVCIEKNASDIHLRVGYPIFFRIDGGLVKHQTRALTSEDMEKMVYGFLTDRQKKQLGQEKSIDFMYEDSRKNRFRVNVFFERANLAAAFRWIPQRIRTIDELGLPSILKDLSQVPYGLVLVTGPTGSGKSTTIAAMIEEINRTQAKHIVTIEDPVEYVFSPKTALVAQRNMHEDSQSWHKALRAVLRQDPDVVLVGEMRDYETIAAALTTAETGHLVFATLHTNSASQTVDRIIDVFPDAQQNQIRAQLSSMLSAVISQRLVPIRGGGRKAAMEIMIGSVAIKNAIREGKTHQIDNIIQTSADIGMVALEKSLVDLIRMNSIDVATAKSFTTKPDQIDLLLK